MGAPLVAKGALLAESPAQVLITWLSDQTVIQEVLFPAERASVLEGKTLLQMATIRRARTSSPITRRQC